jgi:uncharacterized membrane protein
MQTPMVRRTQLTLAKQFNQLWHQGSVMLGDFVSMARDRVVSAVMSLPAWTVVLSTAAIVGAIAAVLSAVALSRSTGTGPVEVPSED